MEIRVCGASHHDGRAVRRREPAPGHGQAGAYRPGTLSVTYRVEKDLIWVTALGEYPSEEFLRTVRAGLADPTAPEHAKLLCDVSRSESLEDRSMDEVRASAAFYGALDRIDGLAIVADRLVDYGLMRMLASMAEVRGCRVEVFRDLERARAWLTSLSPRTDRSAPRQRDSV